MPQRNTLVAAFSLLLIVLIFGSSLVGSPPRAEAKVPGLFWGVSPQSTRSQAELDRVKRGGVDSLRIAVAWSFVQRTKGTYDWSGIDIQVERAARAGIEVLPFLYSAPPWVVRPDNVLPMRTAAQRTAWSEFLATAVDRYGPGGAFFAENPGVPNRPIRTWQIWNEANFFYFVKRPNPKEYGRFVKLSHRVIASRDPGANVLLAGLFGTPKEKPPRAYDADRFLHLMYKRVPGIKRSFDGAALHPYALTFQNLSPVISRFRRVMKRHGDGRTPLYLTEIGWGSQGRGGTGFEKGIQGQVRQLRGSFRLFKRKAGAWKLKRVYWFSLDDVSGSTCSFCDSTGLFTKGFKPKPAWFEFVKFSGGRPR